jgi:branched-chain amino acid transport system permease protein
MKIFEGNLGWVLLFVCGLAFPFLATNDYLLTVMSTAYIFALATVGLNLITGYTGQFNLAHGSFMAVGAYTVGILTVDHQVPFWIAFVLSGVVVAVLGLLVGIVSLRLKGHYFSIFTLCVGYIMFLVIEKWDGLTHGVADIIGIPAPTGFAGITFDSPRALYYLVFAFLVAGVWFMPFATATDLLNHSAST